MKKMESKGKGGFLADGMGLGKTLTMSTYLCINKILGKTDLIVCPVSVFSHWKKELRTAYKNKYRKGKKSRPKILIFHGTDRKIKYKRIKKWDFIITSYHTLGAGQLNRLKWGRVVLDESHYIKNGLRKKPPKCSRAAFIVGENSQYNWCISGTPFNNRMKDIASQCKFIGTFPYNEPSWWVSPNEDALKVWRRSFVLRRTKENILKPPKYRTVSVEYNNQERRLVNNLRMEAKEKFDAWKKSKGLKRASLQMRILGLIQRLRIITNSFYCSESNIDSKLPYKENSKVKSIIKKLRTKIKKTPSNSIVIFSQFTSFLKVLDITIRHKLPNIEIIHFNGKMNRKEKDNSVKKFTTSTSPRVLLISLLAGNCGINLTPCSTVFIAEPYYNPFIEQQAEERVHRLCQKNQVKIYRFLMNNSVETWVDGLKKRKLFLASGLGLLNTKNVNPPDFSFDQISDLFKDLVGFSSNKIPKTLKKKKKKKKKDKTLNIKCSICLEKLTVRTSKVIPCGHVYHKKCLSKWCRVSNKCPLCREVF
jgi:transcription termination factor 2